MATLDRDYYEVLGLSRDANEKAIKNAYHRLAMKWHPDRNKSPEAAEKFKQIAKAYAILKDPKKRARYDALGMEGVAHYTAEDLFGGLDLGNVFGDMGFGFGGASIFDRMFGRRATQAAHGQDLRVRFEVPLELIDSGGKENVRVAHPVTCQDCHGFGTRAGKAPPLCGACHGSGRIVATREEKKGSQQIQFQQVNICPECHGRGTDITEPCATCGGYGQVEKEGTILVSIPAGIEDGVSLRIPEHGLPGDQPNIPPGDLYVEVHTQPDSRFQRRGADLWCSKSISITDAVLGATFVLPTISSRVKVKIPPGTQPDEIIRIRGKGLPRFQAYGRGDINLRVQILIPAELNKEQRKLYKKLKELDN